MKYNLDSLESIKSIKIPDYQSLKGMQSPTNNIEYILQRKATEHKNNGHMDLAIACLRKANEIFPYSNFMWSKKDYLRLVEFLKQAGKFEEANVEEKKINEFFQANSLTTNVFEKIFQDCKSLKTDLVEFPDSNFRVCSECAKYTRRILSISGKDGRFPLLPSYFKLNFPEHEYCFIDFYPFIFGASTLTWMHKGNLINWSNRPFVDERTLEQKRDFKKWVTDNEQEKIDRKNFDFLRENFPDIAPKSFGGYRKMKNLQSEKFIFLSNTTKEKGINLNQNPDLSIFQF